MDFGERLKKVRTEKGLSKSELALGVGIHYSQIGRYENKGAHPSSDVLAKIANTLGIQVEFLLNGSKSELADDTLTDKELLNQFKKIESFSDESKNIVKELIDAFILKQTLRKKLAS